MATATVTVKNSTCKSAPKKASLFSRYKEAYKEYMPGIVCGMLAMNGANVYPLYKSIAK